MMATQKRIELYNRASRTVNNATNMIYNTRLRGREEGRQKRAKHMMESRAARQTM